MNCNVKVVHRRLVTRHESAEKSATASELIVSCGGRREQGSERGAHSMCVCAPNVPCPGPDVASSIIRFSLANLIRQEMQHSAAGTQRKVLLNWEFP